MKVLAVVFLCCLAVAKGLPTAAEKEVFRLVAQSCKDGNGASDNDIEDIINHKPATSKEGKCLRACLMREVEILSADGKLVKENAIKVAQIRTKGDAKKIAAATEIIDVCKDIDVPADLCETAEQYSLCFIAEAKKRGISHSDF